jgi:hypothetical protein
MLFDGHSLCINDIAENADIHEHKAIMRRETRQADLEHQEARTLF